MIPKALSDEKSGEYQVVLFEKTNIQFLDFDLNISAETFSSGNLYTVVSYTDPKDQSEKFTRHLVRKEKEGYRDLFSDGMLGNINAKSYQYEESLDIFSDRWFPLPVLKKNGVGSFFQQPLYWARGYISDVTGLDICDTPKIREGCRRYRLVVALDTSISEDVAENRLLTREDLCNGEVYGLCNRYRDLEKFITDVKINGWLKELYSEYQKRSGNFRDDSRNRSDSREYLSYLAHYINLITLINDRDVTLFPQIKVKPNTDQLRSSAIPVQLILDIGNSRTCGVLVENGNLADKSFLNIRNLTRPVYVYDEPFPSSVEFAETSMVDLPALEKNFDSSLFLWTSMVRTGFEAEALSCAKCGNEGNTGLSSPKRYLWDDQKAATEWKINRSLRQFDPLHRTTENLATIAPVISLVNDRFEAVFGKVLFDDPAHESMPSFTPRGSRRSMMTMLIIEILSQTVSQINSFAHRRIKSHTDQYRYLESIILTVPPAMPKQEIKIFRDCVYQAIGILWKAMKWDLSADENNTVRQILEDPSRNTLWPVIPEVRVDWDEAMCGQICYLYNEIAKNYRGSLSAFFDAFSARKWNVRNDRCVCVATVDIGGGTTDLVINRYTAESERNDTFLPEQLFRESFKVAGDDILLQIIRMYIIPAIADYAVSLGAQRQAVTDLLKEKLGGSTSEDVTERSLKRQFTHRILYPLAIEYLSRYENYDPMNSRGDEDPVLFREIIEQQERRIAVSVPAEVYRYIEQDLNALPGVENFRVADVPVTFRLDELNSSFATGTRLDICEKVFSCISEVINSYVCDVVIITGRPARLPGVEIFFRNHLRIPKDRIISFNNYHFDSWYPYTDANGCSRDPKTSAAVGAALCNLVCRGKLPNFYLKVETLKIKSSIRYLGRLDTAGEHLLNEKLFYREPLNLDDPKFRLPDSVEIPIPPGSMTVGYRQLGIERWPAYPLYQLTIDQRVCNWLNAHANYALSVVLARTENEDQEDSRKIYSDDGICIARVKGRAVNGEYRGEQPEEELGIGELSDVVKLRLCTMPNPSLGEIVYWLDSGSVMLNV